MADKKISSKHLIKVHLVGALVCTAIAGSSIYFAGSSISSRRGLFLSARHELANTKGLLNDSVKQRTSLASRVQMLESSKGEQITLVSVKQLNARTAEIVALAESVHISIDSLQPGVRVSDARVHVQPMDFRGMGQADSIFAFLKLMGEQMPDIHIQSIDIVSDSIESSSVSVTMQMYWFIDPADG